MALCGFQAPPGPSRKFPVAHSEGETPLPIPNRAVKPLSADGTWSATSSERRSPPVLTSARARPSRAGSLSFRARVLEPVGAQEAFDASVVEHRLEVPGLAVPGARDS